MEKPDIKINKAKKEYGRVPSKFLYVIVYFILRTFAKPFFHIEWNVDTRIKDLPLPLTVLGNHPSYLDPFIVACALYPMKINFLAAAPFFRNRIFEPLLRLEGVIPKTQFRADPSAIKSMLKVVKRKGVLGIFPEGARSIDGTGLPIEESITKFIKRTGGSVIVALFKGAYLTWPRWSNSKYRRGRIQLDIQLLYTSEEVETLSIQEIHSGILNAMNFDEYLWQEINMVPFRSKAPAKGLHNILHQCPACKNRWVMETSGTSLYCKACGNTAVMDTYGFLHPVDGTSVIFKNTRDWNDWQIEDLAPYVSKDCFSLEDEAELFISEQESPYLLAGDGIIKLDHKGFTFIGTHLGSPVEKLFPISGVLGISSDYGTNFDLVSDRHTYHFVLKNGQKAISFTHSLDLLRKNKS